MDIALKIQDSMIKGIRYISPKEVVNTSFIIRKNHPDQRNMEN